MRHIITFSGGKDSLATVIWAKNNLPDFEILFCDTGWEHEFTYKHINEIEEWIGKKIIRLKSTKFLDLVDLFVKKGCAASTTRRFCTDELKVKPMIDYILSLEEDVVVYQGVRAEESQPRSMMKEHDEYFRFYVEPVGVKPDGKPKYHSYKRKSVLKHINMYSVDVRRPIIKWSANEVFDYIFSSGLKANPLYYMGFSRVGCFPCIMCRHDEIKLIADNHKDIIEKIRDLELRMGRTFFPPRYIPEKYCSIRTVSKKSGEVVMVPSVDDVIKYLATDENQLSLFQPSKCISVYNICEQ